jgi:hypothetical protein
MMRQCSANNPLGPLTPEDAFRQASVVPLSLLLLPKLLVPVRVTA